MEGHWNISNILEKLNLVLDPSSAPAKELALPIKQLGYYAG